VTSAHHALVIGKFYPPHLGHRRLIEEACARAERVSVVVMASGAESVPLDDRVRWITADLVGASVAGSGSVARSGSVSVTGVRCEAPVDLFDDNVWSAQVAALRAALRVTGGGPVDLLVSGEEYGERLAGYFSASHLRIDRTIEPVSGTGIRADPAARWGDLLPASRAGLACRVVLLGAESTGTTTVARALADHHRRRGGIWTRTATVDEYGREYTGELWERQGQAARSAGRPPPTLLDVVWGPEDFDAVAVGQTAREERAAADGSPLLVCDTDALATSVWERRYLGSAARTRQPWARPPTLPRHDLYLLTSHEGVPWVDDGMREGELAVREQMTEWFADALTGAGHPWVMLAGTLEERIALAIRSTDPVLTRRLRLSDPLAGPGFPAAAHP
jgi:HTH-type transcriptional repressor of NAD biosynthesis genes